MSESLDLSLKAQNLFTLTVMLMKTGFFFWFGIGRIGLFQFVIALLAG